MNGFFRKLSWLARRRQKEDDLRDELQFHLSEEAERLQSDGLPERQAHAVARRDLGSLALVSENTRAAWGWTLLEQFAQDLRYAFRMMSANRLFTVLAVLSLALGIGANTAIYSFMDALLLRSLPVAEPDRLVVLNWNTQFDTMRDFVMHGMSGNTWGDKSDTTSGIFPYPAFALFRGNDAIFSSVFAYYQSHQLDGLNLMVRGQAALARGLCVSGDYFRGLGVPPAAGRLLLPDDDRAGAPGVVVVSDALAEARFGGPAQAAGRSVLINGAPFTVVGVAPPGFFGVDPGASPDVYLPMHANVPLGRRSPSGFRAQDYLAENYYWIQVMGRLRPGVTLAQAQAVLAPQFHEWVASTAHTAAERAHLPALEVTPGAEGLSTLRREYSKPLYVLLTLVALILVIACANVANLLLARAAARRREMALRLSVGASRFRVVRQLLTESALLASVAGVLGLALAFWGIRFLTLLLAGGQPNFTLHAELNWHVLGAAAVLSLATGVLFGLAPALQATRVDVMPALKETSGRTDYGRHARWGGLGRTLVAGQIALSLLMLVAAGLFVRTLSNLQSVDIGFNRQHVLLFHMDATKAGHQGLELDAFYGDLRKRFSEIPGVRGATLSSESLIVAGFGMPVSPPGMRPVDQTRLMTVGPAFFTTMQIPLLAGRDIEERDRPGSPQVAVVNQQFARLYFAGRNPLGEHAILWGGPQGDTPLRDMRIVGVAKDATYGGLKEKARPVVYFPYDQGAPAPAEMVYELRTAGDPLAFVPAVRDLVHAADPRVPLSEVTTQTAEIDQTINEQITLARLCTLFALLALAIACVGLYGTVAYNVARRTGEIGIRMALGAQRGRLVWMVLREVLLLAAAGIAISVPAALGASKLVQSFLFRMQPNDPLALAAAVGILLAAALIAGYFPARRAARIDPMEALRHE
ncbi:MAG TPA: ABC transporter permease [Bryobacteraceae bacterium]|nr:ABC transporter permease [Bryobacteraceae bacterium]